MAKRPYVVVVTEVSKRRVVVWAGGTADAEEAARDLWDTSEIIWTRAISLTMRSSATMRRPSTTWSSTSNSERRNSCCEEKVLDAIRRMVIHGLYKTALTYGYGAEVFRAFKAEQVRLFDNLEENIKRLQAAGCGRRRARKI